jgi:hypothetical protein
MTTIAKRVAGYARVSNRPDLIEAQPGTRERSAGSAAARPHRPPLR